MQDLMVFFRSGGVTSVVFIVFFMVTVISMIASGNTLKTFYLTIGVCVVYLLTLYDSAYMIGDDTLFMHTATAFSSVPFAASLFDCAPTILTMIATQFSTFAQHLLGLFLLSVITELVLTITAPLCKNIASRGLIAFCLSWLLRFFFCNVAAVGYLILYIYVMSHASAVLITVVSYTIFLLTILVLLTPIVEYLVVVAGMLPFPLLKKLSTFVKENQLGGYLQQIFFTTFIVFALLTCIQIAGVYHFPAEYQIYF